MDIQKLIEIGFSENQAKVYVMLFQKPGRSAGEISKELSLDRSFVYSIIDSLTKKGFIYSSPIKNKKVFYPENPNKIIEDIKEKETKAENLVSELLKINKEEKLSTNIEIYEGKQALKKYISELINAKYFLTLGGGGNLNLFNILKYEHPHYFKQIKKIKLSGKIICSENNKQFWKTNLKGSLIEIRSLEGAGKENSITIFNGKILLSSETESPNIIIINNPDHAHALRHYFNYLWKISKK
ncbi:MAG: helix-turn-helix domain-containing protein [Candidatus Nanoarchaeia archaeon]|nr:helix-turn-helix domain-containing protein [Candidatus Nanoarchaeia archaeon]MDD5740976.1 helix-turn-helix domain-containing protein [Candidatus Nanoarchaeia archaeon]